MAWVIIFTFILIILFSLSPIIVGILAALPFILLGAVFIIFPWFALVFLHSILMGIFGNK